MFKSIIPGLVSFDTQLRRIPGIYISSDFDFYSPTKKEHIFHFEISRKEILEDSEFDFRDGYFSRNGKKWQYFKNFSILKLGFEYTGNSFRYTKDFNMIPFQVGGILPIGQIISDFIFLKLFLNGYLFFKGCGVSINSNKAIVIASPRLNGKTTFVKNKVDQGYSIISEDIVIIDPQKKIVFPYSPFFSNFGRLPNKELRKSLEKNRIISEPVFFSSVHFMEYVQTENKKGKSDLGSYIKMNVLSLCKNPFVLDYLYKENLMPAFISKLSALSITPIPFTYSATENFIRDENL